MRRKFLCILGLIQLVELVAGYSNTIIELPTTYLRKNMNVKFNLPQLSLTHTYDPFDKKPTSRPPSRPPLPRRLEGTYDEDEEMFMTHRDMRTTRPTSGGSGRTTIPSSGTTRPVVTPTIITHCQQFIYGCHKCEKTLQSGGRFTYLECIQCDAGLYLYTNLTTSELYVKFTSCVHDCSMVAAHLTNDIHNGLCKDCGLNCLECHPVKGCITCDTFLKRNFNVKEPNSNFHVCTDCKDIPSINTRLPCHKCIQDPVTSQVKCESTLPYFNIRGTTINYTDPSCLYTQNPVGGNSLCKYCRKSLQQDPSTNFFHDKLGWCQLLPTENVTCTNLCTNSGVTDVLDLTCVESVGHKCIKCQQGHVLQNNQCYQTKCDDGYGLSINYTDSYNQDKKCLTCVIPNCLSCYSKSTRTKACTKCQSGYYLDLLSKRCIEQVPGVQILNIYVANSQISSTQNGELFSPITGLMRAWDLIDSLKVGVHQKTVNIYLSDEDHYVVPESFALHTQSPHSIQIDTSTEVVIKPLMCGTKVGGVVATAANSKCTTDPNKKVTIYNKAGDAFNFMIKYTLKIQNIIVDSLDSIAYQNRDPCAYQKKRCCKLDEASGSISAISGITNCSHDFSKGDCIGHTIRATFRFNTKYLYKVPILRIHNSEFRNFLTGTQKTFIDVLDNRGKIDIQKSTFKRFQQCITLISNVNPNFHDLRKGQVILLFPQRYQLRSFIMNQIYEYDNRIKYNPTIGTHIFIYDNTFTQIPFHPVHREISQKSSRQPFGQIIDLHRYKIVAAFDFVFSYNKVVKNNNYIKACFQYGMAQTSYENTAFQPEVDYMKNSLIYFNGFPDNTRPEGGIILFEHNEFMENSGFSNSLVHIAGRTDQMVIFHNNSFFNNSGYVNATAITIKSDHNCYGITFQENKFKYNLGCHRSEYIAHLMYIDCSVNDRSQPKNITTCAVIKTSKVCGTVTYMYKNEIIGNYYSMNVPLIRMSGLRSLEVVEDIYSANVDHIFLEAMLQSSPYAKQMQQHTSFPSIVRSVKWLTNIDLTVYHKSLFKFGSKSAVFYKVKFTTLDQKPNANSTSNIQISTQDSSNNPHTVSTLLYSDQPSGKLYVMSCLFDYQRGLTYNVLRGYTDQFTDDAISQRFNLKTNPLQFLNKGIYGPLIYADSGSDIRIIDTTLLSNALVAKVDFKLSLLPPTLLFGYQTRVIKFLIINSTVDNVESLGWIRPLYFGNPSPIQKVHIISTKLTNFIGMHVAPPITMKWESYTFSGSNQINRPDYLIDSCVFQNIKSSVVGAIDIQNSGDRSPISVSSMNLLIKNCIFENIMSKESAVRQRQGDHHWILTIQSCIFRNNLAMKDLPADLTIDENLNVYIKHNIFENSRVSLGSNIASAIIGRDRQTLYPSINHENNTFDCKIDSTQPPLPFQSQYIVALQGSFQISKGLSIRNCMNMHIAPLLIKNVKMNPTLLGIIDTRIENIRSQSIGGIHITQNSEVSFNNLTVQNVIYSEIGAIRLVSKSVIITNSLFQNISTLRASFMIVESDCVIQISNTTVQHNFALLDFAIMVLKFDQSANNKINNCTFINNTCSSGSVVTVIFSKLQVVDSKFIDNLGTNLGFDITKSNVDFTNTEFNSNNKTSDNVYNGYIQCKDRSNLTMGNVSLLNAQSNQAAGVKVQSKSNLLMNNSTLKNLKSSFSSGGFVMDNIGTVDIHNTIFYNCYRLYSPYEGFSIYAQSYGYLNLINTNFIFNNLTQPTQAIYISKITQVNMIKVTIQNTNYTSQSKFSVKAGGGIVIQFVKFVTLTKVSVSGMSDVQFGGGIAISVEPIKGNEHEEPNKIVLDDVKLVGNSASLCGGGLYILNSKLFKVVNSVIANNRVMLKGGGVCYSTEVNSTNNNVMFDKETKIVNNTSGGIGGGVYYSNHPFKTYPTIQNNTAKGYGADIGSYANRLEFMSESQYNQTTGKRQLLLGHIINQQSGGFLPPIIVGVVDNLGIVISSDSSSKATLTYQSQQNSSTYGVNLKGEFQKIALNGFYVFKDIKINGDPGMTFEFTVTSDSIDTNKQNNQVGSGKSLTQIPISVSIRKCLAGEAYTTTRECQSCQTTQYLLQKYDSPQQCKDCVREVMKCFGGSTIGPAPGYWRSSIQTDNMIQCLNLKACLGILNENGNQLGTCASNYEGILCSYCSKGYSRNGQFECTICPHQVLNIIRTMGLLIGGCVVVVILIRSTIQGAMNRKNVQSVYFKIMTNHVQLIGLIATFDFRWPSNVLKLLDSFKVGSNISTQFLSFECLYNDMKHAFYWNLEYYYLNLIIYSITPIVTIFICVIIWQLIKICIRSLRQSRQTGSRTIASIIIIFFLIHPNLMNTMLDSFRCMDIDGQQKLISVLNDGCYKRTHLQILMYVSIPTIMIWGLGIPIFAFIILFKHRRNLNQSKVLSRYGFLFKGYKKRFYFWESVIMYRKIVIIFISVYLKSRGQITQAFVVALLLVVFIFLNQGLGPFILKQLNQMESLSILASMITIYCSFYYLSDQPEIYQSSNQALKVADNGLRLTEEVKTFFFCVILASNITFFLFWIIQIRSQLMNLLRTKFPKVYLYLFLFGSKNKLNKEIEQRKIKEQNDFLREEFEQILGRIQSMYEKQEIVLNQVNIEKLQAHLNPDAILQSINYKSPSEQQITYKDKLKHDKQTRRKFIGEKQSIVGPLYSEDTGEITRDNAITMDDMIHSESKTNTYLDQLDVDLSLTAQKDTLKPSKTKFKMAKPQTFCKSGVEKLNTIIKQDVQDTHQQQLKAQNEKSKIAQQFNELMQGKLQQDELKLYVKSMNPQNKQELVRHLKKRLNKQRQKETDFIMRQATNKDVGKERGKGRQRRQKRKGSFMQKNIGDDIGLGFEEEVKVQGQSDGFVGKGKVSTRKQSTRRRVKRIRTRKLHNQAWEMKQEDEDNEVKEVGEVQEEIANVSLGTDNFDFEALEEEIGFDDVPIKESNKGKGKLASPKVSQEDIILPFTPVELQPSSQPTTPKHTPSPIQDSIAPKVQTSEPTTESKTPSQSKEGEDVRASLQSLSNLEMDAELLALMQEVQQMFGNINS